MLKRLGEKAGAKVLALMKAANPHLTPDQVKDILLSSAIPTRKADFESRIERENSGSHTDKERSYRFR